MAIERVKFPGSDDPIPPTRQERLTAPEPEEEEDPAEEVAPPEYKREPVGPRIGDPANAIAEARAVEEELDGEDLVPLLFPHRVKIQDRGIMHTWGAGIHLVPISLAGKDSKGMHWYLKHHRVRRAGNSVPSPKAS